MKKILLLVCALFLAAAAGAAENTLAAYLKQKQIKSFVLEDVDLTAGLEAISGKLGDDPSPRKVLFVLSPKVQRLTGHATLKLDNIPMDRALFYFFQAVVANSPPPQNKEQIKILVLDNTRLSVALTGEPFPGTSRTTRTLRGSFLRGKSPLTSLKQIREGIVAHRVRFPDVKMDFHRKRTGKQTVGILQITGSPQEVNRAVKIFTLFYGKTYHNYRAVQAAVLKPYQSDSELF